MCGEDSLNSTNCLQLNKPKLFSFFASHSFSTVTLPASVVKRSFCFCDLISSSLYSLTVLEGSMAISALARKVFFQFCRFCGRMLCLLAICTKVLLFWFVFYSFFLLRFFCLV
ncbi:hypothetical protein BCLUESOX_260 [bacterium endosymbiont of Bathymodiolus sp. 5 South]|nr:hypothetical protein BCLUESOX_260 [bacterium endosymbiont of Bathymodiolus sp. 5 South]